MSLDPFIPKPNNCSHEQQTGAREGKGKFGAIVPVKLLGKGYSVGSSSRSPRVAGGREVRARLKLSLDGPRRCKHRQATAGPGYADQGSCRVPGPAVQKPAVESRPQQAQDTDKPAVESRPYSPRHNGGRGSVASRPVPARQPVAPITATAAHARSEPMSMSNLPSLRLALAVPAPCVCIHRPQFVPQRIPGCKNKPPA